MAITVLLADDHAVLREGLRLLLEAQGDITVVGEASNGRKAITLASELNPDVVVMDIAMPRLNGIDAARHILSICPTTQVIILSMYASTEHIYRAMQAGVQGYVLKESVGEDVGEAIRVVHSGGRYLSQQISDRLAYVENVGAAHSQRLLEGLSGREREVLELVAEGKSSAEVGDILGISPATVKTYRSRLMSKLNIRDIPSLVKFAIRHGVIKLE